MSIGNAVQRGGWVYVYDERVGSFAAFLRAAARTMD